ncbi:MAG: zinc ribbon domain-containing protein [Thaumarchaeota archaeon]|nr:zinc ribbon domain-containing protein [Nitrososphaerota archaeon]
MVFGNKKKIEFDAQMGKTVSTEDLFVNPQNYSFIHNFKVHFKTSGLQMLANKSDISVSSSNPYLPSMQEVTDEFHKRMPMAVVHTQTRGRFQQTSFHLTNVEYKESIAMFLPQNFARQPAYVMPNQAAPVAQGSVLAAGHAFCGACGNPLSSGVRFCSSCGASA